MIQGLVRKTGHDRDWGYGTVVCEVYSNYIATIVKAYYI